MFQRLNAFAPWVQEHRADFDLILFDIDGTLIHGGHPIPGVPALLQNLRDSEFPFLLLTNDANHSREEKAEILQTRGIKVSHEEIVSSGQPLKGYVDQYQLQGKLAYILGALGNPNYAESAGLRITRDLKEARNADLIIVGESNYNWEPHITLAINILRKHPEKPFLVPNPDGFWPGVPGNIGIGAGGVARFITSILKEMNITVDPYYLGKPYRTLYDFAHNYAQKFFQRPIAHHRMLMVGDNILSDILGANRSEIPSALLLTGVTHAKNLTNLPFSHLPTWVFDKIDTEELLS